MYPMVHEGWRKHPALDLRPHLQVWLTRHPMVHEGWGKHPAFHLRHHLGVNLPTDFIQLTNSMISR